MQKKKWLKRKRNTKLILKAFNESFNKFVEEFNLETILKALGEFTKGKELEDPKNIIEVLTAIN